MGGVVVVEEFCVGIVGIDDCFGVEEVVGECVLGVVGVVCIDCIDGIIDF